ncbi:M20/M25/M40 family metallo-hydrolase [Melittangium boletus]|uniref:M20/M25/M40 family metallo-hydrolase n=1 Tax=Melittangium boletus TaxID=83453 RepID=UPI003DA562C1
MGMSKFGPVVVWLACATSAYAEAPLKGKVQDREVWITIGTDALAPVRTALSGQGLRLAAPTFEKGGVAVLRVSESQVEKLSGAMHQGLNRCAGFIAHDSQAEAVAAAEAAHQPQTLGMALAASYTLNNAASVNALLADIQEINIRNTINSLSTNWTNRYYNVQNGADASTWLKNQWTTLANGRSDIKVEFFTHSWKQSSVIATIQGSTHPNEVVVLGGHLDSINQSNPSTGVAPGADDDASGIASVTEIFRVAVAKGYKPARTVKFMAYAGEEVGLYGSKAIANSFKSAGTNVVGVLQLDMTNYKGSSYDFAMVTDNTNAQLNAFTTSLISKYQPGLSYTNITCGYGCSDHASWTAAGYPASMPFEATMSTDNKSIHTPNDTLSVTAGNANNSVKFAKLGASFLAELAKGATTGNTPPPVDSGGGGTLPTASYDSTYKAPRCASAGIGCDSGTLLNGRGTMSPSEANAPNTIAAAACADSSKGTYRTDESNERIRVSTPDGTTLAAGKTVTVEATVYAYSTTADKLDLYYSASATSPSWKLIGTYSPSSTGLTTLSASYTLPTGGVQVVRARFRYNGSASSCTAGDYIDHDDLVFAVQ